MIVSGNRNIIFPDNTRKIKFQRDLFGTTIFSEPLKKENMVFRVVLFVHGLFGIQIYGLVHLQSERVLSLGLAAYLKTLLKDRTRSVLQEHLYHLLWVIF